MFNIGDIIDTKYGKAKVTLTGYRRDSVDVNSKVNLIPSNKISMKNVDFMVLGIDNLGNAMMMYPDMNYVFEGQYVIELPIRHRAG